jgi:hypothetical protein
MEEAGERCPCFMWQLSKLSVAWGKWRQDSNRTWLTWTCQDWWIPNTLLAENTMPHSLNYPQGFVQLGSGTHQAEQSSLHLSVLHCMSWIQDLTLNTWCHRLIIAATQGRNEVTWRPVTCWYDITCSLAIRVHWPRKWMLDKIGLGKLCFLGFIFLWILV